MVMYTKEYLEKEVKENPEGVVHIVLILDKLLEEAQKNSKLGRCIKNTFQEIWRKLSRNKRES